MYRKNFFKSLFMFVFLFQITGFASAEIIFHSERTAEFLINDDAVHTLPLSNGPLPGSGTWFFISPKAKKVFVSYNAECSVRGSDNDTWLDIDIIVNGVTLSPSLDNNALCTSQGTDELNRWVSGVTNGVAKLRAGNNVIEVKAAIKTLPGMFVDPNAQARIDDTSLVIMD